MKENYHPTYNNNLYEVILNFCGKDDKIYILNDTDEELIEYFFNHVCDDRTPCFIEKDIICPVCGEKLHFNGTTKRLWNKDVEIRLQKYSHKDCGVYVTTSLSKYRDKNTCFTRKIRDGGLNSSMISYRSYASKAEEINVHYQVKISPTTIYYAENKSFWKDYKKLNEMQIEEIKRRGIKPSGHYGYDEQYVFVENIHHMRMTIIDNKTKLIIAEEIVSTEEFNRNTITKFLKTNIKEETLKSITTDGRREYKTIIESLNAIHHRCVFHIMQNLMTPLQKKINKLNRIIKTSTKKTRENKDKIRKRKKKYPPKRGRIPKKDTKRQKNKDRIKQLEQENKQLRQKIRETKKELEEIEENKQEIQEIFKSKTQEEAYQKLEKIYKTRETKTTIIRKFIEKIYKEKDILLNHIGKEDIPSTNNVVENYYRTTLPGKHKRIYRTIEGLKRRIKQQQIRWTHRNVLKQNTPINKNTVYT